MATRVLVSRRHPLVRDAALQEASRAHPLVRAGVEAWYLPRAVRIAIGKEIGDPTANVLVVSNVRDAGLAWPGSTLVGPSDELQEMPGMNEGGQRGGKEVSPEGSDDRGRPAADVPRERGKLREGVPRGR